MHLYFRSPISWRFPRLLYLKHKHSYEFYAMKTSKSSQTVSVSLANRVWVNMAQYICLKVFICAYWSAMKRRAIIQELQWCLGSIDCFSYWYRWMLVTNRITLLLGVFSCNLNSCNFLHSTCRESCEKNHIHESIWMS